MSAPDRPRDAMPCRRCKGRPPRRGNPPCKFCQGRGWLTPEELAALSRPRDESEEGTGR